MIQDQVLGNCDSEVVCLIDKSHQIFRGAVGIEEGVEANPVIAPTTLARENRDRHQFDDFDSQICEIGKFFYRCSQGSLGGKSSDMQLIPNLT